MTSSVPPPVDASAPGPDAQPPASPSPFSPILAADGSPLTTPLWLYPVLGATLFAEQGLPWHIHRLDGNVIMLDAMPVRGLPGETAWDGLIGRYPDALWMRVGSSTGGLDWYRWQPARKQWTLDRTVQQGRRTAADLVSWTGGRLLVVLSDPQSNLGEPATTSLKLLPDARGASLPRLPRISPSAVASSSTGELFAVYYDPPEAVIVRSGPAAPSRIALPWPADCTVIKLVVRSANDAFAACTGNGPSQLVALDGTRASSLQVPGDGTIRSMVAGKDSTLWILDEHRTVWRRGKESAWTQVALPTGAEAASLAASPEDGRIFVRLGSRGEYDPTLLLTTGEIKLQSKRGTP